MYVITNPVHVSVTQDDIDMGETHSCLNCPIALAMKRALPLDATFVHVRATYVSTDWHNAPLPACAVEFIKKFDFGRAKVEPFEFNLTFVKI